MRWKGRDRSANVEDRRGSGGGFGRMGGGRLPPMRFPRGTGGGGGVRRAGGGSILLIVAVVLGLWVFAGINPLQLLDMLSREGGGGGSVITAPQQTPRSPEQAARDDERAQFLSVVLAETESTWGDIFRQNGLDYEEPTLVLYSGATSTDCGFGQAAAGPFYCPLDRKLYVDLSFFDILARQFGAPGDFAQAYVLAHEVGHHVQNLTGVLERYHSQRANMSEGRANAESIKVELQADCYAGIWAHAADRIGIVEDGDIREALDAATAVGDDIMQRRQSGTVVPESFNHGTADQRARWFETGYRSGDPGDCDTFSASRL